MKPEQMRESSQKKFKQITELMDLLQVTLMPREKITQDGFIEKVVIFTDNEQYPVAPAEPEVPAEVPAQPEEPKSV